MRGKYRVLGTVGVITLMLTAATAAGAETALWLREPAISPDGDQIVFRYRGDLWLVSSEGGSAAPLTVNQAFDTAPVWSPDGSMIAFASTRHGNTDVYVVPVTGGAETRLTFHSAADTPTSFTPDGRGMLFSSSRLDAATSAQFPSGVQPELYRVAVSGGMPEQVLTTPAEDAVYDGSASVLAYTDRKGYEMPWRKHDDSSFARDVWVYRPETGLHQRLTQFGADDREPVWTPDQSGLYYLSERSGTFNVWRLRLDDPESVVQVTDHGTHPVRFLSASRGGDLCYSWDGAIWVRPADAVESRRLDVRVGVGGGPDVDWTNVSGQITEFDLSPDGKEVAFIARGEVFASSVDHSVTRRITRTPEQERSVDFSPDGRSLIYASERDGSWNLYRTDLTDDDEPSFFNATAMEEKVVLKTDQETYMPRFSSDGEEVAYVENRTTLRVLDLESGESRTVLPKDANYAYTDADFWYDWSPDGTWFLVKLLSPTRWSSEVGLVPASGEGEVVNLTKSGYYDVAAQWAKDGEMMYWVSDRHGGRRHTGDPQQFDVYAAFLTRDAWDWFQLTEAELEQREAREKDEEKNGDTGEKDDADGSGNEDEEGEEKEQEEPIELELEGLEDRTARLTRHSVRFAGAELTPDAETLVYLARFEKGYDLWSSEHRSGTVKLVAKLGADDVDELALTEDGSHAVLLADRKLMKINVDSGKLEPIAVSAKMEIDSPAERAYLFEHIWRQTREKFYDPDLHGVDWGFMKSEYMKFLPHVTTDRGFAELMSELQGELNASHTGCRFRPRRPDADATASLGFFPDPAHEGDGVRIAELIEGGPLGAAGSRIEAGTVITGIDGAGIAAGNNWYPLLNHKAGSLIRLSLAEGDETWEETVKPISRGEERQLLYQRWVRSRREAVDRLSDGRLGYAHIRGMSEGPYREMYEEVFGLAADKEGLILDTRFNGGGNLVEALTTFLTGETYFRMEARGQTVGTAPGDRWTKPSIVVMNEGNYSDAHCFPSAYTGLGIGETVGMPVPGTCTAVWWERLQNPSLVFGIPQVAHIDTEGDITENKHLAPDYQVDNRPSVEAAGRDEQLEKAVEVLLGQF